MNMKKLTALILCLMMVLSVMLFSCSKPQEESSQPSDNSAVSKPSDEESKGGEPAVDSKYKDDKDRYWPTYSDEISKSIIGERKEIRVLVTDNTRETTYYSEEIDPDKYETTDSNLAAAVRERNALVEDKLGIKVKAVFTPNVHERLKQEAQAPTGEFEIAMPFLYGASSLAQTHAFYDFKDFEKQGIIDLSAPWYDKNANDTFSIQDRVFFTVSDMSIMHMVVSIAVSYNPDLIKSKFPDFDMYKLVKDKKWTIDKMYEIGKAFYEDSNGDGIYDHNDNWGCSASYGDALSFYLGSGEHLCTKDENDIPTIAIGDGRSVTATQKILEILEKPDWIIYAEDLPGMGATENMWVVSLRLFGDGKAPFRNTAFSAIKKLRNYSVDYAVAPLPMLDEEQDQYYTPCPGLYAYGVVIPSTLSEEDAKYAAYMIDVLSAGGKEYIKEAYYNQILKKKDAISDPGQELDMLDFIFSNITYDVASIYGFSGLGDLHRNLVKAGSTDITSSLESIRDQVQVQIDDIVEKYSK